MHRKYTPLSKNAGSGFMVFALMVCVSLFLQGCGGGRTPYKQAGVAPAQSDPNALSAADDVPVPADGNQVRVAILLPLSGKNAAMGEALLKSAQMALFDLGHENFELIPKDTGDTEQGGKLAAQQALQDGAQLVLGPVFADTVRGAQSALAGSNVNMIAFSTDWTLARDKTYLIGFLPFDQVSRVVKYARTQGLTRFGVLSPDDNYGNAVVNAYGQAERAAGISGTRMERFSPQAADLSLLVRSFTDYDKRQSTGNALGAPFDAVLIPAGGNLARSIGRSLNSYGLPPSQVRRLGTGLMDDAQLAGDASLAGAWFAAPPPKSRSDFENRFRRYYGSTPPRIASLAYDATALAATLSRMSLQKNGTVDFTRSALMNPNGFAGVDGIFRFRNDGVAERGLSILEYRNGRIVEIDPAPRTFQSATH